METTQVHTLNLRGVLSVSKKIILSNYCHFVSLSFFFFPLCFSLISTPTLLLPNDPSKLLIVLLLYTLIVYVVALCAIGTITYTTHHVFLGEPVNFSDAVESLVFSFFPLVSTAIVAYVLILLISLTFLVFVGIVLVLVHNFGFVIDYNSIHFMWFSGIMGVILIAIIIYVHVEWSLALVVAVVESKWGFASLMRSSYLVKGMRSVSLFVMLYFGVFGVILVWMCHVNLHIGLVTMLGLFFLMMFLLRLTAANVVLYNYCKALHGELAIEVVEGYGRDYVNLPVDDEKVPHVAAVVAA